VNILPRISIQKKSSIYFQIHQTEPVIFIELYRNGREKKQKIIGSLVAYPT